jgi:hypothetical protein
MLRKRRRPLSLTFRTRQGSVCAFHLLNLKGRPPQKVLVQGLPLLPKALGCPQVLPITSGEAPAIPDDDDPQIPDGHRCGQGSR